MGNLPKTQSFRRRQPRHSRCNEPVLWTKRIELSRKKPPQMEHLKHQLRHDLESL